METRREFLRRAGFLGLGIVGYGFRGNNRRASGILPASETKRTTLMAHATKQTGYVYDPIFLKHTQPGHPESARRLEAILHELQTTGLLEELYQILSRPATPDEVLTVHSKEHLDRIKKICLAGGGYLDPDTYTTADSYDAALMAVGSVIDLVLAVVDGQVDNGFAFVRPPGHHAEPDRPMGFCLLNNIAIATRVAQQQRGLERVAIVDIDVHHGNGTQAAFDADPSVLYCSTHQYPHYPGTGRMTEVGWGTGKGTVVNFPLPAGVSDEGFRQIYTDILIPVLRRFQPQILLVSVGYDCHWNDPLAGMGLSLTGMAWICQTLVEVADELCDGKIVLSLEGGYNLDVLKIGTANSVKILLGRDDMLDPFGPSPRREPDLADYVREAARIHLNAPQ
jgi:acetoin utilization deacetylase AcuC-like enzyme